jgi:hypothetical protein
MNYAKPEVIVNGTAIAVIQMGHKPFTIKSDAIPNDETHSDAAYEADE